MLSAFLASFTLLFTPTASPANSIKDQLSVNKESVEITYLPPGTEHIGYAVMENLQAKGLKYISEPTTKVVFTPGKDGPAQDVVVDAQAFTGPKAGTGHSIGNWAGRLQTVPGDESGHEKEEQEQHEKVQKEKEAKELKEKEEREKKEHEEEKEEEPVEEPPVEEIFEASFGLNSGTESADMSANKILGTHLVRAQFGLGEKELAAHISGWAAAIAPDRIDVLLSFSGRHPSVAEYKFSGEVIKAEAPKVARVPGEKLLVENGNETSYGYQYGDGVGSSSYAERAKWYAEGTRTLAEYGGPQISIGDQAEDGGSGNSEFIDEGYKAVPNLQNYVGFWVGHFYGPQGLQKLSRMISALNSHGANGPIADTEDGISSDNGRNLSGNYGYITNPTYAQAATLFGEHVSSEEKTLGNRLKFLIIYQDRDQKATGTSSEREAYFGALQHNNAGKGSYTTEVEKLLGS